MSNFETLQSRIQEARAALRAASHDATARSEQVRSLELSTREVARRYADDSREARALAAQREKADASAAVARRRRDSVRAEYEGLIESFLQFTDPRENVGRLPDAAPFLLFPVRLETRFKTITRGRRVQHQLWVRVFPDECSIDSFDDLLSASEVARTQNYWAGVWSAGTPADASLNDFVRDKRLAAWRKLMGSFNGGRAYWLTTQYLPSNPADMPVRNATSDLLPIIVTVGGAPATKDAIAAYWTAVIEAGGDPEDVDVALEALKTATGLADADARALVAQYAPREISDTLRAGPPDGDVRVTFLDFDAGADTKQNAWAHAAKVRTFPERFVLLGFQGNDAPPVINMLGALIPNPLTVGPDAQDDVEALLKEAYGDTAVDAMSDEEKAAKYVEYLSQQSDTRWLFDFDRAVELGLGFQVDLTPTQHEQGFTRLMVLGVQMSGGASAGQASLEELLRNQQFGDVGFSLLAQGTPTNNTEETASGFSVREQPDEIYARYQGAAAADEKDGSTVDGVYLARALGIDPDRAALRTARNYGGTDQAEARAMQTALWNATLGYFLESMIPDLATDSARHIVREHFLENVRGRGAVPSIRIGKQPYGILTLTNLRNVRGVPGLVGAETHRVAQPVLAALFTAAMIARADLQSVLPDVAHVGAGGDPHATLLRVLGLHPTSIEYDRRIAESFAALRNTLLAMGFPSLDADTLHEAYRQSGLQLLEHLGYHPSEGETPSLPIFDRAFFDQQEDVNKPPIDETPLSEERRLGVCAPGDKNYIQWLVDNARADHQAIRNQSGFLPGKQPQAILFDLLCHSLNLEFGNAGLSLLAEAKLVDAAEARTLRLDKPFIGIQKRSQHVQSKWDLIYRTEPAIANRTIVQHICSLLAAGNVVDAVAQLAQVVSALELLALRPTAHLERCLAEHLDLCHYRLDAWLLSFVSAQLKAMRSGQNAAGAGIYLGAYGWVEDLRPDQRQLDPVSLDAEQQKAFDPEGAGGILTDSTNAGYVHAPSIPHGITAAVLRNAYISTTSASDPDRYKVNLSSERVRMALSIIEGIQQGQGLAELLGYQLERGLHDRTDLELDVFIYELRKVFPLVSNRLNLTAIVKGRIGQTPAETARFAEEEAEFQDAHAVTKVEARNVVNGIALLDRVAEPGHASYPFGFSTGPGAGQLREATPAQAAAINAEVDRLKNVRDAVADLALAESVHQTVQGNYDRAAGALDAFSKGAFPQLPDVIQSSVSGLGLTHRFAVHFPAGVAPDAGATPRSKAEPALNAWLKDLFPPMTSLYCAVRFRPRPDPVSPPPAWSSFDVTGDMLGLEPIDLLYLHDAESAKTLNALDDYVLRVFRTAAPRRLDLEIEIDYLSAPAGKVSFFQLGALLTQLRTLVMAARPLQASDLSLQKEGSKAGNATASVAPERIQKAREQLENGLSGLQTDVITPLSALLDPADPKADLANFPAIVGAIADIMGAFVVRAGALSRFGMEGAGTAFVSQRLRAIRDRLAALVRDRAARWQERSDQYQQIVDNDLPLAATEDEKVAVWHRAETAVNTTFTTVFVDAAALGTAVTAERTFFEQKRTAAADFLSNGYATLAALFADADTLLAGTEAFDVEPLDVADARTMVVVLAQDFMAQAAKLHKQGVDNLASAGDLLAAATTAPAGNTEPLTQAAQVMFGEAFRVFPEFTLADDHVLELQRCLAGQAQLLAYQTDVVGTDDPTEDWLYGLARVREKLAAWESTAVLAEGFTDREPLTLTPFQLPYRDGDSWLGLAFPADHVVEGDNLLYTACAPGFDPAQPVVGAMVDEWTETIPSGRATTALAFHYDRPNCEAPQSLLLVTPAAMSGRWQWDDLVGSLHEALDLARLRALEPDLIDRTAYAKLLPATVATLTVHPVTMALNFALQSVATIRE